jgi:hypothetical protein
MVNKVKTNLGRMDLLPIRVNPRSPDRTAKLASKVSSPNNRVVKVRAAKLNKTTNRVSKTVITPPRKLLKVMVSKVKVNRDKVKVTLRVKDRDKVMAKVKDNKVTEKAVKGMDKVRVSPARAVTVLAARVVPVVSRLLVKV